MSESWSYLPSVVFLGTLLLVSAAITVARPHWEGNSAGRRRFSWVAAGAILLQCIHFGEEYLTGFEVRFPAVFGRSPIPESVFVAFNLAWLGIWLGCLLGARAGRAVAIWPLWFLALALMLNGVAHPLLALRTGGYFPGLISAPIAGVMGLCLAIELVRSTRSEQAR